MKTLIDRFNTVAVINILIVFVLSALILTGWLFYNSPVKNFFPGNQLSNPVTSVCFLLACSSFVCLINRSKEFRTIGKVVAFIVLFTGLLKFTEILFNYTTGIDKWLFTDKLIVNNNAGKPNFMAPNTAISFFILGISLLLFRYKISKKNLLSDYFASAVGLISLGSLIGYAYQSVEFYQAKKYIPMAFPTALSFFLVSSAILLRRSEFGFFSLFTTKYEGSKTARFLVPFAIIIPVTTGILKLYGENKGLYSPGMGMALFSIINIILFLFVIWRTVLSINASSKALEAEIDERKSAEKKIIDKQEEIKRSNVFLDAILESLPNMVFVKDAEQLRFEKFNKAGEHILGVSKDEILGKSDYDLFPKEKADYFTATDREVLNKGVLHDIKEELIHTKNGDRWLHTKKIPIHDKHGFPAYLLGVSEDITERKKLEDHLKSSNEIFLHLFYASPLAMIIRNIEDGKILDVNGEYERLLGYKKEELVGQTSVGMGMRMDPQFSSHIRDAALNKKSLRNIEATLYNSRKEPVHVVVSIEIMRLGNKDCIISALLDITERKKLEENLNVTNKELESFTYSVSHDLRAPLRIINGYAEIIKQDPTGALTDEPKRMLENIITNAKRMGNLIDDLLNFSRLGRRELVTHDTDMNAVVHPILQQHVNGNSKYHVQLHNLPQCFCDSSLIKQVWENLISNAVKYSANNPHPVIEIGSLEENHNHVYYVKDNGAGFDMKYYDKLFGVFQRLHKVSEFEGTGVGLALTQRIILKHGGKIWAESKINEGSTFYFTICKS